MSNRGTTTRLTYEIDSEVESDFEEEQHEQQNIAVIQEGISAAPFNTQEIAEEDERFTEIDMLSQRQEPLSQNFMRELLLSDASTLQARYEISGQRKPDIRLPGTLVAAEIDPISEQLREGGKVPRRIRNETDETMQHQFIRYVKDRERQSEKNIERRKRQAELLQRKYEKLEKDQVPGEAIAPHVLIEKGLTRKKARSAVNRSKYSSLLRKENISNDPYGVQKKAQRIETGADNLMDKTLKEIAFAKIKKEFSKIEFSKPFSQKTQIGIIDDEDDEEEEIEEEEKMYSSEEESEYSDSDEESQDEDELEEARFTQTAQIKYSNPREQQIVPVPKKNEDEEEFDKNETAWNHGYRSHTKRKSYKRFTPEEDAAIILGLRIFGMNFGLIEQSFFQNGKGNGSVDNEAEARDVRVPEHRIGIREDQGVERVLIVPEETVVISNIFSRNHRQIRSRFQRMAKKDPELLFKHIKVEELKRNEKLSRMCIDEMIDMSNLREQHRARFSLFESEQPEDRAVSIPRYLIDYTQELFDEDHDLANQYRVYMEKKQDEMRARSVKSHQEPIVVDSDDDSD
ncbi:hypothetical protein PCE1_002825 [Barthelona sp. PCE]